MTTLIRSLLIAWAAVYVLVFLAGLAGIPFGAWLAFNPDRLLGGDLAQALGIVGYSFVHGHLWHLLINCLMLYWFGPEAERLFPGRAFPRLLIQAALAGAAAAFLVALLVPGGDRAIVGGSGLVSCCFAVLAAVMPDLRVSLIVLTVRLLPLFLVLIGLDLLRLIATLAGQPSGIAAEVHLAGAAVGWTAAGGWQRFPVLARWQQRRAQRRQERSQRREADEEAELDRILAKISRDGIGSLDAREKRFLERRSQKRR